MANILDPTENLSPVSGLKGIYTKLIEVIRRLNVLLANSGSSKVYKALITQSGTDAPVATALVNTLSGTPVWSRDSTGFYKLTLASEFPIAKTIYSVTPSDNSANSQILISLFNGEPNVLQIETRVSGVLTDELLYSTPITIEVFP